MKKSLIALIIAALMILAPAALAAASVVAPTDDFYVNDSAGVLSDATEGHIIFNNDALEKACGAQIVIVTIDTAVAGSNAMENYATELFNQWEIGDPEKDNGILLLMAIKDDDYWMQAGSGLRKSLTAGDLDNLLQTYLEPYFAEGDYDGGAHALFDAAFAAVAHAEGITLKIDPNAGVTSTSQTQRNGIFGIFRKILVVLYGCFQYLF